MMKKASYVNIGCGTRYHPDWINIDFKSNDHSVIEHDITTGIPLEDESAKVVYHAAILEHFNLSNAIAFIRECYRILVPGGIIRVGVPDLEKICHLYLEKLNEVQKGIAAAEQDYDWMMLELYDQHVREQSGGEMIEFIRRAPSTDNSFILDRIGEAGRRIFEQIHTRTPLQSRIKIRPPLSIANYLKTHILNIFTSSIWRVLMIFLGSDCRKAYEIGKFRLSGEIHQWNYDRFSLSRLLSSCGFKHLKVQKAEHSLIKDWQHYYLDITPEGKIIKPDLLFMEGIKDI